VRIVEQAATHPYRGEDVDRLLARLDEYGLDAAKVEVEAARDRRRVLRELGTQAVDLVVSLGSPLGRQARAEAPAHPHTAFVSEVGPPREPNLAVMSFQLDGAAYLAGVAAAMAGGSTTGIVNADGYRNHVGVAASFRQGFRSRRALGRVVDGEGAEGVHLLASEGVTVALCLGQCADPGIVAAAETNGLQLIVIGREAMHRHESIVLAAVDFDIAEAVERITRDVLDGTFGARTYLFDLGSGVVDLVLAPRFAQRAGPDATRALDEARAAVNAGMVEVEVMGL
jgi:basic membrane lipoprotein Med (substrate-binding protein (PBP1-ABC) superfamily)